MPQEQDLEPARFGQSKMLKSSEMSSSSGRRLRGRLVNDGQCGSSLLPLDLRNLRQEVAQLVAVEVGHLGDTVQVSQQIVW